MPTLGWVFCRCSKSCRHVIMTTSFPLELRVTRMDLQTLDCFSCGTANDTTNRYCDTCGAPLWAPRREEMPAEIPEQAVELWRNATVEWKKALRTNDADIQLWGHIESLLSLAITYAGSTPFPRAHAHLAIVLLTLQMDEGAEREANIALVQDPNEFRAQQVRIALAMNGDLLQEDAPSNSPASVQDDSADFGEAVASEAEERLPGRNLWLVEPAASQYDDSMPTPLVTEIERMLVLFRNFSDTNTDIDEYLNLADFLILSSDQIKEIPLELRSELYSAVAYTPTDKLDCQGRGREVVEVRERARRGLFSLEQKPKQHTARRRMAFA
jgi:hypothetical protein